MTRLPHPLLTYLALIACAMGACGRVASTTEAPMPRDDSPASTHDDAGLLVEIRTEAHEGPATGYRIFEDGRYERLGDVDAEGEPPQWQPMRNLSREEVAAFQQVMDGFALGALEDRYEPAQRVMDGSTTTWRLRAGGSFKVVTVQQGARVEALIGLRDALPEAIVHGAVTTEWIVTRDDGEHSYPLPCATTDVPEIDALTWSMAGAGEMVDQGGPAADATRVLNVLWKEDGVTTSHQELWSDGWQLLYDSDAIILRKRHTDSEMATIREKMAAVPWPDLAGRCR